MSLRITGFMILRNTVRLGYPFLEAIHSALPLCDDFLVSDGYSSDETWEALTGLQARLHDKIRVHRAVWSGRTDKGQILAEMTNVLRERCRGDYCINLQADEIIHEEALESLRSLPATFPSCKLFRLPFYSIIGGRHLWSISYRGRLFRNIRGIRSRGDAFDCGYGRWWRRFIGLTDPDAIRSVRTIAPIYRYRVLFPAHYLAKLEARLELFSDPPLRQATLREIDAARAALAGAGGEAGRFWQTMREFFESDPPAGTGSPLRLASVEGAPRVVEPLLDRWEYDWRASLERLTAGEF